MDGFASLQAKSCLSCVNFKDTRKNVLTNARSVPYNDFNLRKKEIALMYNRVSAMMMRLDMCAMYMSIVDVIR